MNTLLSKSFIAQLENIARDSFPAHYLLTMHYAIENHGAEYADIPTCITMRGREISFLPPGRDCLTNDDGTWQRKNRQTIKPGKLVKRFPGLALSATDKEVEDFVNLLFAQVCDLELREVWGSEIAHWYNGRQYADDSGTLSSSCMRHGDEEWFELYCDNPERVSMVIAVGDGDLLHGRALLWKTDQGVTVLDRIYGTQITIEAIKDYAEAKGYLYKREQNYSNKTGFIRGGEAINLELSVGVSAECYNYAPFLDTFSYATTDALYNTNRRGCVAMDSTDGINYLNDSRTECCECGARYDDDEITYVDSVNDYVCDSCLSYHYYWIDSVGDYLRESDGDLIFIDGEPEYNDGSFPYVRGEYRHPDDVFVCDQCGEHELNGEGVGSLCEDCAEDYAECIECGDIVSRGEMDADGRCETCAPAEEVVS
jgi:hypothetical protein